MFWGGFPLDRTFVIWTHHTRGERAFRRKFYMMEDGNEQWDRRVGPPLASEVHFGSLAVSDTTVIHSFVHDLQRAHLREVVVRERHNPP